MANTLTSLQYAGIVDGDDVVLTSAAFAVTSSDPTVATASNSQGYPIVVGQSAGTATITATRNADGATATMEVTVTAGLGFTIKLGTPVPK